MKDISNSYNNGFLHINERFTDDSLQIENMYSSLSAKKRDGSFKFIENIITENLDIFIKSLELLKNTKM